MRKIALALSLGCLLAGAAVAQSPYGGLQRRPIKALSEQHVDDLKSGRGMGMAIPAELNGYPGPLHLLELADPLGLTPEQRAQFRAMMTAMKAEAIPLGERLIEQERELDRLFAERRVTPESLEAATAAIARTQGELRNTHLKYHLATVPSLTSDQLRRYAELRGYSGDSARPHHRRH